MLIKKTNSITLWYKTLMVFASLVCFFYTTENFASRAYGGFVNEGLFMDIAYTHKLYARQEKDTQRPTISRSRYVRTNFGHLAGRGMPEGSETVVLNLFNDVYITAVRERLERRSLDNYTWYGRVDGSKHSQVILAVENGSMAGNITIDGKMYQIRAIDKGVHAIYEINQNAFPGELSPVPVEIPESISVLPETSQYDDGSVIDVMVVYSDDTAMVSFNIGSEIHLAIAETNQSYANSGINQRLRLVHSQMVQYTETSDLHADLDCITYSSDGCLDQIHTWRDDYGADFVSFWVEDGGPYCGSGWLMATVSNSFQSYAFNVVDRSCATGYYSFGHEIGHNMGAHHDRANANSQGAYAYSYGYQSPNRDWRTIMAYNCSGGCIRVQYWSNPDILYNGVHMGVHMGVPIGGPEAADNRSTLNNTASVTSNFRQTTVECVLDLGLGFSNNTLTMDFYLGTDTEAVWHLLLFYENEVIPLASAPVSAISPPANFSVSIPDVPQVGEIVIITALTTTSSEIICYDLDIVNTGP